MKRIFVLIILIGFLLLAGCAPDGFSVGAMFLDADLGPHKINEVVPTFSLFWFTRSSPSNSAHIRAVSSDRGDLSK